MKIDLPNMIAHPVAKRLAVAGPISIGVGLLRAWFGEHSMLIGLVVGVGSYTAADWLFSTTSERKARIQQVTGFFREYWMEMARLGVYFMIYAYFSGSRPGPSEPVVKQVLSLVQASSIVFLSAVGALAMIRGVISGASFSVYSLTYRFLSGLALFSIVMWLIDTNGDAFYKWVIVNPNDAAAGIVALAIAWMIVRFSHGAPLETKRIAKSLGARGAGCIALKFSAHDNRYIAAHEAGHALVYAALESLPAEVELAINDYSDERGILGFITDISHRHHLDEKSFAEWYMLVFLAGKLGESTMYGESTLGNSTDHLRWLGVARNYLANHYRGVYYADPHNKFEQEQNEAKLEALQVEQLAMLRTLFDVNTEVFTQLATALLKMRKMDRDSLTPFLRQVKLPDGFPVPVINRFRVDH